MRERPPDHLLTLRELAVYLRVSPRTAYALVAKGAVPAVKVGGQWRISLASLERRLGVSAEEVGG